MKEFNKNDKVWYFTGDILVKCSILEVDMQYREKSPSGIIFYFLDEPIGHSLAKEDFYESLDEAINDLKNYEDKLSKDPINLNYYRRDNVEFIARNHRFSKTRKFRDWAGIPARVVSRRVRKYYKDKKHLVDWFNTDDIRRLIHEK